MEVRVGQYELVMHISMFTTMMDKKVHAILVNI